MRPEPDARLAGRCRTRWEPRLHEKCSDARRATKVERSFCSTRSATPQLGTFRANPSGRCLAGRSALLRALRIVRLFVCGSRRASRPAQHRRGPMGFCISLLRYRVDRLPAAVYQTLYRPEIDLVGHLTALCDPVAEVQVRQVELRAQIDLPQDAERAEARAADLRIEEGVNRRHSILQLIQY